MALRLLFIVFFVPICIDNYIFSVYRKTKLFGGIGPTAEVLGGHKLNMNDKRKIL